MPTKRSRTEPRNDKAPPRVVGRSAGISRDGILAAAERIVERAGVAALTMRALAEELGVTPMALYNHVSNREEIVECLFRRLDITPSLRFDPDERWTDTLRMHLLERWANLSRVSGWARELQSHTNLALGEDRNGDFIDFFARVGFDRPDALGAASFLSTYLFGRMSLDDRLRQARYKDQREGLTPSEFVEFSIRTAIEGLEARLASSSRSIER